jgi:hypothetical protein
MQGPVYTPFLPSLQQKVFFNRRRRELRSPLPPLAWVIARGVVRRVSLLLLLLLGRNTNIK